MEKRGRGRPPKAEQERFVKKSFRFPPDLWADVEQFIPAGERSSIIQDCLRRTVARRRREGKPDAA
jgi:hypothetical protein